ncbi:hypothetical protein RJT34_32046 [Clitoria ternatea]|uniref:DUF7054 domain-containing protein n=1 Tax=Clitoria ternatea TaxID=43366 RepID=A0AAN9EVB2_CLITE
MTSPSPVGHRRKFSGKPPPSSGRKLQNSPPEKHVWRFVPAPLSPKLHAESQVRAWKVLVNVTIENRLGAVQVLVSPEETVGDLIKAALVSYEREKRRPLLNNTDPECYRLHYSSFALQSLKTEEKLMKLGSRNFFLCSKPPTSCPEKEKMDSAFPLMILAHFLL